MKKNPREINNWKLKEMEWLQIENTIIFFIVVKTEKNPDWRKEERKKKYVGLVQKEESRKLLRETDDKVSIKAKSNSLKISNKVEIKEAFTTQKKVSGVHLNLSSKLALKSRLWTYHSHVYRVKTQTTQKVRLDLNSWSVICGTFTIDSSTPILRINLNEHPMLYKCFDKFNPASMSCPPL
jgi:hypothetical protein